MNPRTLAQEIARLELANAALVDCTAASSIVDAYPAFVEANLHIVTPNKRANVLPWRRYVALKQLMAERHKSFLYETNVGAGLPVISTLRDLIVNGDPINKVEGIFSGTLSYLFNTFDGTVPFSALVRDAHRMGYTEPDPREDLTGQDVARKLLILARQTGLQMELDDVSVDSLVPRGLTDGPFSAQFFSGYAAHDAAMAARLERARTRGAVLRFVGTLERGRACAEIREYPRDHPFAATRGTDNIIAFTTNRYAPTPLIVQGPGAGADVTAMGVFADIFKLLHAQPLLGRGHATLSSCKERRNLSGPIDEHLIHSAASSCRQREHGDLRPRIRVTVEDIDGHQYIDGLSGLWNVNVGHGRAELADAAAAQMSRLAYFSGFVGSSNIPSITLADRLLELTGDTMQAVFLTSGGAEANESAFKTARFYWKARGKADKVKIIARDQAYHGLTLQTMSATGMGRGYWKMFEPRVPGFVHIPTCYPYALSGRETRREHRPRRGEGTGGDDPPRRPRHGCGLRRRADPRRRRRVLSNRRLLAARARHLLAL